MKTQIMRGCAKDRIEDIKTPSKQQKEEKPICTDNIYYDRLFRYSCPNCWCQVLHHKQSKQFKQSSHPKSHVGKLGLHLLHRPSQYQGHGV